MPLEVLSIPTPLSYSAGLQLQRLQATGLESSLDRRARLLLLQHTPVFTLGRKTGRHHLLGSARELAARTGAEVVETDRGGSVTFHGPGQVTAYLLLNLRAWKLTIHGHLDMLEQAAIQALARFGIAGRREPGLTGVWVVAPAPDATEKICAIGVSVHRWVTYHGLSLNVDLDLSSFREIVPCGLAGKGVTSMARVLGRPVPRDAVEDALRAAFSEVYAEPAVPAAAGEQGGLWTPRAG